jgi:hypothetical protein
MRQTRPYGARGARQYNQRTAPRTFMTANREEERDVQERREQYGTNTANANTYIAQQPQLCRSFSHYTGPIQMPICFMTRYSDTVF